MVYRSASQTSETVVSIRTPLYVLDYWAYWVFISARVVQVGWPAFVCGKRRRGSGIYLPTAASYVSRRRHGQRSEGVIYTPSNHGTWCNIWAARCSSYAGVPVGPSFWDIAPTHTITSCAGSHVQHAGTCTSCCWLMKCRVPCREQRFISGLVDPGRSCHDVRHMESEDCVLRRPPPRSHSMVVWRSTDQVTILVCSGSACTAPTS